MDPKDLYSIAEEILGSYRDAMAIDPFTRISIEVSDGDETVCCSQDRSPLSWKIVLSHPKHSDIMDVQYSIVESLLNIQFSDFYLLSLDLPKFNEIKGRLVSKLTYTICRLSEADSPDEEVSDES